MGGRGGVRGRKRERGERKGERDTPDINGQSTLPVNRATERKGWGGMGWGGAEGDEGRGRRGSNICCAIKTVIYIYIRIKPTRIGKPTASPYRTDLMRT